VVGDRQRVALYVGVNNVFGWQKRRSGDGMLALLLLSARGGWLRKTRKATGGRRRPDGGSDSNPLCSPDAV
jgi:hypothetical protein